MMIALYILLVVCVLMIVGVSLKTYLHIQKHKKGNSETDNHDIPPQDGAKP